jgi:hypothetical protein
MFEEFLKFLGLASNPSKTDHGAESPIIEPPDSLLSTRIFG